MDLPADIDLNLRLLSKEMDNNGELIHTDYTMWRFCTMVFFNRKERKKENARLAILAL